MRILVVNPNTTASMTAKIGAAARRVASSGTEIVAVNPASGPASIEGYYDEALSLAGLLEVIRTTPDFDAVVIACFDDTGLDAARCLTDKPVIGIGEAAYHFASMIANKFSVVTTLARSVPALEHNLHKYGLITRVARVRSSDVAVLELEHPDRMPAPASAPRSGARLPKICAKRWFWAVPAWPIWPRPWPPNMVFRFWTG